MMPVLSDPILVALIALIGALVGAFVQFVLTKFFEQSKFVRDQRRGAYQKFLVALGDLSQHPQGSPEWTRARAAVVDARCQIALYGTPKVVRALIEVFENSATFERPEDQKRLCVTVAAMRHDSLGWREYLEDETVYSLMFANGAGKLQ